MLSHHAKHLRRCFLLLLAASLTGCGGSKERTVGETKDMSFADYEQARDAEEASHSELAGQKK